jgi:prepilin-type N-terminal cleavage/methylation domain-containing protein
MRWGRLQKKSAFTLIEMLVVIAVVSMLTSYVILLLSRSKANSRDAKRESDIKQIQEGLSIYVTSQGFYPVCLGEEVINGVNDCLSTALLATNSMTGMPTDPLMRAAGACGVADSYAYCYISDGFTYIIRYALETDVIKGRPPGWYSVMP